MAEPKPEFHENGLFRCTNDVKVEECAVSSDGELVAFRATVATSSAVTRGHLTVISVAPNDGIPVLAAFHGEHNGLCWSPLARVVVATMKQPVLQYVEGKPWIYRVVYTADRGNLCACTFNKSGTVLVVGSEQKVLVFSCSNDKFTIDTTIPIDGNGWCVAFSPSQEQFVVGSSDPRRHPPLDDPQRFAFFICGHSLAAPGKWTLLHSVGRDTQVLAVAFNAYGSHLAVTTLGRAPSIWNVENSSCSHLGDLPVVSRAVSFVGNEYAVADLDTQLSDIRVFRLPDGFEINSMRAHGHVHSFTFAAGILAASIDDVGVQMWSLSATAAPSPQASSWLPSCGIF